MTLKIKLLIGILILSLSLILLYLFYFFILYNNLLKQEEDKIDIYTKSIILNINKDIRSIIVITREISLQQELKSFNIKKIPGALEFYLTRNRFISNLFLCDLNGKIIVDSEKSSIIADKDCSKYDFFNLVKIEKKLIITDNYINNKLFISISMPVFDYNYNMIGVFVGALKFDNRDIGIISNIIDTNSYNWEILLANKNGILLFHSHKKYEEMDIDNLKYSNYPSVKNALLGNWGLNRIKIDSSFWYTSSQVIPICNWIVIVQVPESFIIKKVFKIVLPNSILLISLLIILLFIILLLANKFIGTILRLTDAIKEYGEKGNTALLVVKGKDEIQDAMQSFNKMIIERRQLEKEILDITERERKRIGSDLHNDIQETLNNLYSGILVLREELNRNLEKKQQYVFSFLDKISDLANDAIVKTNFLLTGLNPVNLYEGGIINIIKKLLKDIKEIYNIDYRINIEENIKLENIGEMETLNLYYIIQDITNITGKNRNVKKLELNIKHEKCKIYFTIIVYGKDIKDIFSDRMSLRIINFRIRLINAELKNEIINNDTVAIICILNE